MDGSDHALLSTDKTSLARLRRCVTAMAASLRLIMGFITNLHENVVNIYSFKFSDDCF